MKIELINALNTYQRTFGDSFPTIPLAVSRSDIEVIELVNRCIRENKDVYELGYLELNEDIMY